MDVAACQQFLNSYSSGALHQSLSQHACRLLALPQELTVETQLKAGTHILDLCLDDLERCLKHIHLSQVNCCFQEVGQYWKNHIDALLFFFFFSIELHSVALTLLDSLVSISLNVFVTKRSTISSRSCGARPSAQQNHSPTPTSGRSPPSPTTASSFRTESLVSPCTPATHHTHTQFRVQLEIHSFNDMGIQ